MNSSASLNSENANRICLSDFHISPETGFMPAIPPLTKLPGDHFAPWENLVKNLPELNRTKKLRSEVDKLPELEFSDSTLKNEQEWRRAFTLLSFIGQSYIWGEGQKGLVKKLPKKIAVPWSRASDHLQMKPVGCYASTTLFNYSLHDPQGPLNAENLYATNTYTGTEDESWFYITFLLVEMAAVPALRAIGEVFDHMAHHRDEEVQMCLQAIRQSLQDMRKEMGKMTERCKPVTFYVDIRPFQAGSKGLDALSDGIIYEGVDQNPHQYHGANAGQSSIIYAIDVSLGTKHYGDGKSFINTMKLYMPGKHREFLDKLTKMPPIRDYCLESGNVDLIADFNSTVEELVKFRTDHVILVTRFIVNQRSHSVNPTLEAKGSGGTDFMSLLKKVRNETLQFMIK